MTDILEVARRLKRSLDGHITYRFDSGRGYDGSRKIFLRKIGAILLLLLFFFLYLGPGVLRWFTASSRVGHAHNLVLVNK